LKPEKPGKKNANHIDGDISDEYSYSDESDETNSTFINPSFVSFVNSL